MTRSLLSSCLPRPAAARARPVNTTPRQTRGPPRSHPSDPVRTDPDAHPTALIAPAPPENPHPLGPLLPLPLLLLLLPLPRLPSPSFERRATNWWRADLPIWWPAPAPIRRGPPRPGWICRRGRIRCGFPPFFLRIFFWVPWHGNGLSPCCRLRRSVRRRLGRLRFVAGPWRPPTTARRRPGPGAASSGAPCHGPSRGSRRRRRTPRAGLGRQVAGAGSPAASRRRRRSPRGR